jgi:hypothetical protein
VLLRLLLPLQLVHCLPEVAQLHLVRRADLVLALLLHLPRVAQLLIQRGDLLARLRQLFLDARVPQQGALALEPHRRGEACARLHRCDNGLVLDVREDLAHVPQGHGWRR